MHAMQAERHACTDCTMCSAASHHQQKRSHFTLPPSSHDHPTSAATCPGPPTAGALLDHIGGHINPLDLVRRIPKGTEIPRLRDRLRAIIADFRTQVRRCACVCVLACRPRCVLIC